MRIRLLQQIKDGLYRNMNTVVDRLNGLIRAKRDMRDALNDKGVMPWGGLKVYPEAIDKLISNGTPLIVYNGWSLWDSKFEESPVIDISNMTELLGLFGGWVNVKVIRLVGDPSKILNVAENTFADCGADVEGGGILYYDSRYDYRKIIKRLPDGWEAIPYNTDDYEFE